MDATSFLHGQSSANLRTIPNGGFGLQCFVDRSGRVETHFLALKAENDWILLVAPSIAPTLENRFHTHVISEDVELVSEGEGTWWFAMGPSTSKLSGWHGILGGEAAIIAREAHPGVERVTAEAAAAFSAWQGWPRPDAPEGVGQLVNQTTLFQSAVDMGKGCFPGQETVAKVHHNRGAAWAPTLLSSTVVDVPTEIQVEGKCVARISRSAVFDGEVWVLAEVLRDVRVHGMEIAVPGVRLKVRSFPLFATTPEGKAKELYHYGVAHFRNGAEEAALSIWKEALHFWPAYADVYESIGVLLGRQGKEEEAIGWMRRLLEVDPSSVLAHTNLSLFLMRQGKIEEAENHKAKATLASFASFGAESARKEAEAKRALAADAERARRADMYSQVLEIDPDDALAHYGLGMIQLEKGEYASAQLHFEKALEGDAQYTVAYLSLGKAQLALGKREAAKDTWYRGIKIAAKKGDMMPANEMQSLLNSLG